MKLPFKPPKWLKLGYLVAAFSLLNINTTMAAGNFPVATPQVDSHPFELDQASVCTDECIHPHEDAWKQLAVGEYGLKLFADGNDVSLWRVRVTNDGVEKLDAPEIAGPLDPDHLFTDNWANTYAGDQHDAKTIGEAADQFWRIVAKPDPQVANTDDTCMTIAQGGGTLGGVAEKWDGVSIAALAGHNNITNDRTLSADKEICRPNDAEMEAAEAAGKVLMAGWGSGAANSSAATTTAQSTPASSLSRVDAMTKIANSYWPYPGQFTESGKYVIATGKCGTQEIHISDKLLSRLGEFVDNPRAGESAAEVCPTQFAQLRAAMCDIGAVSAASEEIYNVPAAEPVEAECPLNSFNVRTDEAIEVSPGCYAFVPDDFQS